MKNKFTKFPIIISLFLTMIFTSCELDFQSNGKLDGYWRLISIDTLATGGSLDLSQDLLFWSFDAHLLEMVDRNTLYVSYLSHFTHKNDHLTLDEIYKARQQINDSLVTDVTELAPFGINKIKEDFAVEKLTSSKMTLRSETLCLIFDKY